LARSWFFLGVSRYSNRNLAKFALNVSVSSHPLCGKNSPMLKLQAIFHDGSVGLEFMIDDPSDAHQIQELYLTFECVAEVRVLDEPDWVSM
jgi:hypothetical protein